MIKFAGGMHNKTNVTVQSDSLRIEQSQNKVYYSRRSGGTAIFVIHLVGTVRETRRRERGVFPSPSQLPPFHGRGNRVMFLCRQTATHV